jgi:hypothetical protein
MYVSDFDSIQVSSIFFAAKYPGSSFNATAETTASLAIPRIAAG